MSESKVFMFDGEDPDMQRARENARQTFRYFWRELAWERRRIVPALDLACVKAPFADGDSANSAGDKPAVEEMWISDVDFDGQTVRGELLNSPNWLTSVQQGDTVQFPLNRISDWMYAIDGEVFGAYTVQLLRTRIGRAERAEHDNAWGLEFGDPSHVRVIPNAKPTGGLLTGLFRKRASNSAGAAADHPMSINMGPSLKKQIVEDPSFMTSPDDRGWTILHHLALAGSTTGVQILLDAGADPNVRTNDGLTAAQLAQSLGWNDVVALLSRR